MKHLTNITLLLLMLLASGCKRLPLYDETGRVRLDLDIDLNIRHQQDIPQPETMLVLFFDPETHAYIANDYVGPTGGILNIDAGRYDILIYNFGTETTVVRNTEDMSIIEAYTNEVAQNIRNPFDAISERLSQSGDSASESRSYGDDPVVFEPDHLFVGRVPGIDIPIRIEGEETMSIHADASTVLETYSIEIGPVTGKEYVQSADVFLTGQVRSNFIGSGERSPERATIYFPISIDASDNEFHTVFNTFGKYPGAENKVYLNILVTDTGGGQYQYRYDVTDQFDDPGNVDHKIIIRDPIDIPEPSHGGGGFRPDVTDWSDETVDIEL